MRMILERKPEGWILNVRDQGSYLLTDEQAKTFFDSLKEGVMTKAFYSKNNSAHLVTKYAFKDSEEVNTIVIKNYNKVKNRRYVKEIKDDVDRCLRKAIMDKIAKILGGAAIVTFIGVATATDLFGIGAEKGAQVEITYEQPEEEETHYVGNIVVREALVREYMDKYALIFGIPSDRQQVLYDQYLESLIESDNIEFDVADLFHQYYDANYYGQRDIEPNNYTEREQELLILKYAELKGIKDEEILYTMLAVHKLETGHGESEYCRKYNNLGGIMNPQTQEIEMYPNIDIAAFDYVKEFMRILEQSRELPTYSDQNSIEYNMNPKYCTEKMNEEDPEWFEVVSSIKESLKEENHLEELLDLLHNGTITHRM